MTGVSSTWPFQRVLIANRGEIALRIVRACKDLGLASVVAYTQADAQADFVELADDAWRLPGDTAADTYLNSDTLLEIARKSGAHAVHPGYGYLAESPEFASAVIAAGLTWIGPSPEAISKLGDKAGARAVATAVGAPITPGSGQAVKNIDEAMRIANDIGFPVAVKAVHGGGGRGFRTAASPQELPAALHSASNEAQAAFGRSECLIEKQIVRPRHIETQCLADQHGHVLVVSTRDCSLQRRNQKVLEEAPAPFLTAEQEHTLIQASQDILSHVGYVGAATCEFLLGTDGTISFMEANARIQVEHTVTEEITGLDLVVWQFHIAAGRTLPDEPPVRRGHSFQFRINAEDPTNNFMPATGTITALREPAGPGVRMDSGVRQGHSVGTSFDPMLAKLIVTGPDRTTALQRARRALSEYRLEGVDTLLPLHREVIEHADFALNFQVHTNWLEHDFMPTFRAHPTAKNADTGTGETESFADIHVEVDGHRVTVKVPAHLLQGTTNNQGGNTQPPKKRRKKQAPIADSGNQLTAPMQGTIVSIEVAPGQTVTQGQTLATMEAMKMEQPLKASRDATIAAVNISPGAAVKPGEVLMTFQEA